MSSPAVHGPAHHDDAGADGAELLRAIAAALLEAARLTETMAQDLAPAVRAAASGPDGAAAVRGLQRQDDLRQRLEAMAAAVRRLAEGDGASAHAELARLDAILGAAQGGEDVELF